MAQSEAVRVLPDIGAGRPHERSIVSRFIAKSVRFARRRKLGAFGVLLVLFILAVAILSPWIQRYDDNRQFAIRNPNYQAPTTSGASVLSQLQEGKSANDVSEFINVRFEPPSSTHWLGTDQFGRDIYARIIVGARLAVLIGIFASLIAVSFGLIVGVISGYYGGLVDLIVQRFVDGLQAFPALVLLLLIVQLYAQPPLWLTIAALGFLGWATSVRIVRSAVLAISQQPYIEAAKSFGATNTRIMAQHVIPNIVAPVIVVFSISIGVYILAEASLSFLGLGPADKTTWGKMVNVGRNSLDQHPWESLFSGIAITLTVLGFNLAGDAIRDELDPRLRGR
ncbi:MAG: ABC transporter permease [Chloroflexi bacterium]|nr:ABC transporter permease [Chloroflexota bacterium]